MVTRRQREGVTLTEALLAMVIGFLILGVVFAIARMQGSLRSTVETHLTTSEALSQLDRRLVRDLDRIAPGTSGDPMTLTPSGESLSFWIEDEETKMEDGHLTTEQVRVLYTFAGKDPLVLIRKEGSREERIPMTGIGHLTFSLVPHSEGAARTMLRVEGEIAAGRRTPARPVAFQYSIGKASPRSSGWVPVAQ